MVLTEEPYFSAGGVVYRYIDNRLEVALIRVSRVGSEDRWQLPKGTIDKGETPQQTAIREVREETGLHGEIVAGLEKIEYWFSSFHHNHRIRYHKFVHFYLMQWVSGVVEDHDHEVEEARWVDINLAAGMLSYEGECNVLVQAKEYLNGQ